MVPVEPFGVQLVLNSATKQIGLPLRAGLHTGEIEIRGKDIGGIAVHAAARVMAQSASNEVLVSHVVTDLVAGAGLKFSERGSFEFKGLLVRRQLKSKVSFDYLFGTHEERWWDREAKRFGGPHMDGEVETRRALGNFGEKSRREGDLPLIPHPSVVSLAGCR
jgi:hypothetical protein